MEALVYPSFAFGFAVLAARCAITVAAKLEIGVDDVVGVQKSHSLPIPRLGGACIVIALLLTLSLEAFFLGAWRFETLALMASVAPLVGIGVLEDLTRQAGVLPRLLLAMAGAALAWWLLGARIPYVDVPIFDAIFMAGGVLAFFFTIIAVTGVVHAFNMIDGINGLAGFVGLVAFAALATVAYLVGDAFVFSVASISASATLGFLVWNYPGGRIFLGDTGSYLTGFLSAILIILLVARNPSVSPWFGMSLVAYPVWEMFFSMWRRGIVQKRALGEPDRLHLHQLVYRRLIRLHGQESEQNRFRHALTALYIWIPVAAMATTAVVFYEHTSVLVLACAILVSGYMLLYRRIVRFGSPRLLVIARRLPATEALGDSDLSEPLSKTN